MIWSTWFQITLHDVRFSLDSVYERICKVIQMSVFVAFALIGSKFQPDSKKASDNTVCILLDTGRVVDVDRLAELQIIVLLTRREPLAFWHTVHSRMDLLRSKEV